MLAFLFYLLRLRRYKAKRVKTCRLQEWVGHFEPKFQGEGVIPGEYFLVSTKQTYFLVHCHAAPAICVHPWPLYSIVLYRLVIGLAIVVTATK